MFLYHDCCLWKSLWTTKLFWKLTNTTDIQKCQMLNGQFRKQTWRKLLCVNKSDVVFIRKRSIYVTPIKQPKLNNGKKLPGCPLKETKWDFQNLLTVPSCSDDPFVHCKVKASPVSLSTLFPLQAPEHKVDVLITFLLYLYIHTLRLKTLSQKTKKLCKEKK